MKRFILTFIAFVVTITWFSTMSMAETYSGVCGAEGDNLTWVLDEDGTLTVSGTGAMKNYDAFSEDRPAPYNAIKRVIIQPGVTSIGDMAFYTCFNLESINIPSSVTSIGIESFAFCQNLTSVNIPSDVTSIGRAAFLQCYKLSSANIPDGVTVIEQNTFYSCSELTSISIPTSVKSIESGAFAQSGLLSINIPYGVKNIGDYAFRSCTNLKSVSIPSSVTSIGASEFFACYNLTSVNIPSSVTSIGLRAFGSCSKLTNINIPSSVTSIGDYAFETCRDLTHICIPPKVDNIGICVFNECTNLTIYGRAYSCAESYARDYNIPFEEYNVLYSLVTLDANGGYYFGDISNSSIDLLIYSGKTLVEGSDIIDIIDAAKYKNGLILMGFNTEPDGSGDYISVDSNLEPNVFSFVPDGDMRLYAIWKTGSITGKMVRLDANGGYFNDDKQETNISDNLAEGEVEIIASPILSNAIDNVKNDDENLILTEFNTKPDGSGESYSLFSNENSWIKNFIPDRNITLYAIWRKPTVEITLDGNGGYCLSDDGTKIFTTRVYKWILNSPIAMDTDFICDDEELILSGWNTEPDGSGISYETVLESYVPEEPQITLYAQWERCYIHSGKFGTDGDNLFWILDETGKLTISGRGDMINASITPIHSNEYYPWNKYLLSINTVIIEPGVRTIGDYAFCGCTNLTRITIPKGVTCIGSAAFSECSSLTSITLPEGLQIIGNSAFNKCSNLSNIVMPPNMSFIDSYAFVDCNSLKSITIPEGVTKMLYGLFIGCSSLEKIIVPRSVTEITLTHTPNVEIWGYTGSYAEEFCKNTGYTFVPIDLEYFKVTLEANGGYYYEDETCSTVDFQVQPGKSLSEEVDILSIINAAKHKENLFLFEFNTEPDGSGNSFPVSFDVTPSIYSYVPAGNITLYAIWRSASEESHTLNIKSSITCIAEQAYAGCTMFNEIRFYGDAPVIASDAFEGITADAYYPEGNETWTEDKLLSYGGTLKWHTWAPDNK